MLKEIILQQKEEKERLSSLPYTQRTKSTQAKKWLDSSLIKVVLGPRRSGKSVFCFTLLKDTPFMYFNFDDDIITRKGGLDTNELIKELHAVYGDTKTVFFDEIQNLNRWELFINKLHREGYNVVITGSNAKLLSKELSTALTGRHIPIEILPFDFHEFLSAKHIDADTPLTPQKKGVILHAVEEYMHKGGFPEVVVHSLDPETYLETLYDSLLFNDVVKRHRIRFSTLIGKLGAYLINNTSNLYTVRNVQKILDLKSSTTTEKYISYLEEAYLIFSLFRYSYSTKRRIRSPKKSYVIDNGFMKAKAVQHSPDAGRLMENMIFTELLKRGHSIQKTLFYHKTKNNREINFVTKKEREGIECIQVSYDIHNTRTRAREVKSLIEGMKELNTSIGTLITWDNEETIKEKDVTIHIVPAWKWLLGQ